MIKGLFKNIFGSQTVEGLDYSSLAVDMHSHLIPGIDDGAKDLEHSMILVRALYEMGFKKLITTPHIMSDFYRNTPEIILEGLEKVRNEINKESIPITIEAAAEYYVDDGFVQKLANEKLLTIGKNYLLFEISYLNAPEQLKEIIFQMQVQGYKPIMAHPERYPYFYKDFSRYKKYRDTGVLMQLNLNSLSGYYGKGAKKIAEKMIDEGLVDMLGTDTHHERHLHALSLACKEKYFQKALEMDLMNKSLF
ncbi:MAG: capsular biosynthesis protein [Bacteroidia bacterium]|nr:capsular biosynthesis protein [Bacteroidia bacterium]